MQLGLTIPLQKQLKIKSLPYGAPLARRCCWDVHGITLHGQRCLLAVHCSSRYTFTLCGLSVADWRDLPATFLQGMRQSFVAAGIPAAVCARYAAQMGAPQLTKTHGRREVAFLNRAWDDVVALDYAANPGTCCQPLLDAAVNALPRRCAGYAGLGTAVERLRADLTEGA
ncbi:MAG: hypothetical protein PHO10_02540 [Gemmiger sp.]|nr:hypothetical protein [Gemmiger sp.]